MKLLFGASWCEPCKTLKKALAESEFTDGLDYIFHDIDESMDAAKANGVRGIPALVLEDGTVVTSVAKIIQTLKDSSLNHP